ncbi:hypothetical protein [Paenibacillus sp. UNC499MF]|uniref:hypothetical protein n=1 Tax=Paenibacillus sp. UNC499MF TaxID=1502751 RepID=UPI0008A0847E|nr:hypothetical protein [Paenibacillus sp. UNC499MF]SEG78430.1 hypothetical protein SAMN02799616_05110 [Paenibacillus sp. UNC499MF]
MYKEDFYCLCKSYMNRHVRVQTKSGRTYDGVIIGVDPNYVRLKVSGVQGQGQSPGQGYAPYPEYGQGYISGHVNGYGKTRPSGQTPEQTEERSYFYPPRPPFPGYPGLPGHPPGYPGSGANDAILTLALFDLLTLVLLM